ncbi:HesB/IscA family protein [Buchnera aphidicola]|uniref:HesB/IscA family protein n=1 Tax=Buchnera aphidicola TaxID=9 RepID=UPI003463AB01
MKESDSKKKAFYKNSWKKIIITDHAIKQIIFLIHSNANNKGIRIGIKKSGCAGFRYTMELVKKEKKEDLIFSINNILVYINSKHISLIEGVKIDFIQNNINKVFKFNNKKFENLCGCGDSFSIN